LLLNIFFKDGCPLIFGYFSLSKREIALWLFIQHSGSSELSINTSRDNSKDKCPNDKNQLGIYFELALNGRGSAYGIG